MAAPLFSFCYSKLGGIAKKTFFIIHKVCDQNSSLVSLPTIFGSAIHSYETNFLLGAGVPHLVQQGCGALAGHCIVQSHAKNYKGRLSLSSEGKRFVYQMDYISIIISGCGTRRSLSCGRAGEALKLCCGYPNCAYAGHLLSMSLVDASW